MVGPGALSECSLESEQNVIFQGGNGPRAFHCSQTLAGPAASSRGAFWSGFSQWNVPTPWVKFFLSWFFISPSRPLSFSPPFFSKCSP